MNNTANNQFCSNFNAGALPEWHNKTIDSIRLIPFALTSSIQGKNQQLRILKMLNFSLQQTVDAIENFIHGRLQNFDPHVGDNLCQIRSVEYYYLYVKSDDIKDTLKKTQSEIIYYQNICLEQILNSPNHFQDKSRKNLQDYLKDVGLKFSINANIFSLFTAYFLTQYTLFNEHDTPSGIDYNKLSGDIGIPSKNYAAKVSRHYQREISRNTTKFILSIAKEQSETSFCILKKLIKKDEFLRHQTPCYLSTRILLGEMKQLLCPIIILLDMNHGLAKQTIHISYEFYSNKFQYCFNQSNTSNRTRAIIKINANCTINDGGFNPDTFFVEFTSEKLENLILYNMANHPQYAGKRLASSRDNPYGSLVIKSAKPGIDRELLQLNTEFKNAQLSGVKKGCSMHSPHMF